MLVKVLHETYTSIRVNSVNVILFHILHFIIFDILYLKHILHLYNINFTAIKRVVIHILHMKQYCSKASLISSQRAGLGSLFRFPFLVIQIARSISPFGGFARV